MEPQVQKLNELADGALINKQRPLKARLHLQERYRSHDTNSINDLFVH